MNFELNRSKLSFNLSLKNVAVKIRSANLGTFFSVSGGESFSESRYGDRASLKPYLRHMIVISGVFCAHKYKYKIAVETGRGKDIHS